MASEMMTPVNTRIRKQSVVPIVVKQILSCEQKEFKLFGTSIQIACILGIVKNINVQSCQVTCCIEDHTGQVKATMCLECESEVTIKLSAIQERHYVQAFGTVRIQNLEKIFMVIKMVPVTDANLITCHLLQVIRTRLEAEAELKRQVSSANSTGAALANALAAVDEAPSTTNPSFSFTALQEAVFNVVKAESSDCGIAKNNIFKQFPLHLGHEVNEALEYLISQGIIYPTTDQNHLKTISNF